MRQAEVVVVGSINIDLVFAITHLPAVGETVGGASFSLQPGGKGANQAVAAARMGASAAIIGCVGDDDYGRRLRALLEQDGVDCSQVQTVPGPSGCAGIFVDCRGENLIAVAPGANAKLTPETVKKSIASIADARVLLVQLESPLPAVRAALAQAREAGVMTILDPAPAMELGPDIFPLLDYITPNAREASKLTGIDVHCWSTAAQAARELRRQGVKTVLVTMGKLGAFYSSSVGEVRIAAPRVDAVDATGAGDAFNGALAAALVRGAAPDQAADIAAAAGALASASRGAQPSLPRLEQVAKVVNLPW